MQKLRVQFSVILLQEFSYCDNDKSQYGFWQNLTYGCIPKIFIDMLINSHTRRYQKLKQKFSSISMIIDNHMEKANIENINRLRRRTIELSIEKMFYGQQSEYQVKFDGIDNIFKRFCDFIENEDVLDTRSDDELEGVLGFLLAYYSIVRAAKRASQNDLVVDFIYSRLREIKVYDLDKCEIVHLRDVKCG